MTTALDHPISVQICQTVQDERRCWEDVFKHLTEARKSLGQTEQSERHRRVGA